MDFTSSNKSAGGFKRPFLFWLENKDHFCIRLNWIYLPGYLTALVCELTLVAACAFSSAMSCVLLFSLCRCCLYGYHSCDSDMIG